MDPIAANNVQPTSAVVRYVALAFMCAMGFGNYELFVSRDSNRNLDLKIKSN